MVSFGALNFIAVNQLFENNKATRFGSALAFDKVNAGIALYDCTTQNGLALDAGTLYLNVGNYGFIIRGIMIKGNIVNLLGGGMYIRASNGQGLFLENNEISIELSSIIGNTAQTSGGAIFIGSSNIVNITLNIDFVT